MALSPRLFVPYIDHAEIDVIKVVMYYERKSRSHIVTNRLADTHTHPD